MRQLDFKFNRETFLVLGTILICLIISQISFPPLLGFWETSTVFFELDKFQNFHWKDYAPLIQDGANVAGQYGNHGYPMLRLFNPLLAMTNGFYSLNAIRFLPKFYALLSLLFFGLLIKRKTNTFTACMAVIFLNLNFYFFLFENQLIPLSLTFFSVAFSFYVYDSIYFSDSKKLKNVKGAWLLGFSYLFLAINYSMGRFIFIFLLLYQLADLVFRKIKKKDSEFIKLNSKILLSSWGSFLLFMVLASSKNILKLFSREFLFPPYAEVARSGLSAIELIFYNIKAFLSIFVFISPSNFFSHEGLVGLIGEPANLISPYIFLFGLWGFFILLKRWPLRDKIFYVLVWGIFFGLPLLSVIRNDGQQTTMSIFRTFFNLFFIYTCFAYLIFYLSKQSLRSKVFLTILILLLLGLEFSAFIVRQTLLQRNLEAMAAASNQLHFKKMAQRISTDLSDRESILFIDQNQFTPKSYDMHVLNNEPYLNRILFMYLEELKIPSTYLTKDFGFRMPRKFTKGLVVVINKAELMNAKKQFTDKKIFTLTPQGSFQELFR